VNWKGEKRSNETHASRTDPEARLMRKGSGQAAMLAHMAHALMENRNGLVVEVEMTEASGTAERAAAVAMLGRAKRTRGLTPRTLGADVGYGEGEFLYTVEHELQIEPHIPPLKEPELIDDAWKLARFRAAMRKGEATYAVSQQIRKRIEEIFGWLKTVGGLRKARWVGRWKIRDYLYAAAAVWNLMRLSKLAAA